MTTLSDLIAKLEVMPKTTDAAWCQKCGFLMVGGKILIPIKSKPTCNAQRREGTVEQAISALKARGAAR